MGCRRICVVCGAPISSKTPTVICSPFCAKVRKAYWQAIADQKRHGGPAPSMADIADRLRRKSGVPGVSRSKSGKRWVARDRSRYLGTYDTVEEAAAAIDRARATARW